MTTEQGKVGVLFVCLGNICRSPLAEGVFRHLLIARGVSGRFHVDSCGTGGWHVGEPPDRRSAAVAKKYGIQLECVGRKLDPWEDFERFDWLIPMDRQNKRDLLTEGAPEKRVRLLRSFDPALRSAHESKLDVPDPYWDENDGFEKVYQMIRSACEGMLEELTGRLS